MSTRRYLRLMPRRQSVWRAVWEQVLLPCLLAGLAVCCLLWLILHVKGAM